MDYEDEERDWVGTRRTLQYARALRPQPLRIQDLSRISILKAVGAQDFEAAIRELPLPKRMKAFVRADIIPTLLAR